MKVSFVTLAVTSAADCNLSKIAPLTRDPKVAACAADSDLVDDQAGGGDSDQVLCELGVQERAGCGQGPKAR